MKLIAHLACRSVLAVVLTGGGRLEFAPSAPEFHRTLSVTASDPVSLAVELPQGELQICYGGDEQVSIAAIAQLPVRAKMDKEFLATALAIEQDGNHLGIRCVTGPGHAGQDIRIVYRIDVPYRTEIHSVVDKGKQEITGIMGPVKAVTNKGDIKVSYVSKGLLAQAGSGNLDFQVIGGRVEAKTGDGNISCIRAAQGVSAETDDGDIVLMVVGPSKATVKRGTGRIDVSGARGSFVGSTNGGDLHVKAVPHDDWRLNSASGNIRVELPPAAKCELEATTNSGELLVSRDDIESPDVEVHHFRQKVNGGGKHIEIHTDSGKIVIR